MPPAAPSSATLRASTVTALRRLALLVGARTGAALMGHPHTREPGTREGKGSIVSREKILGIKKCVLSVQEAHLQRAWRTETA